MRLIDADALREAMYHEAFEMDGDMQKWESGCWIRYKMFEKHIEAAPTIDAVPVVRYKDCKWATNEPYRGDDVWICNFNHWRRSQGERKPDFFCDDGDTSVEDAIEIAIRSTKGSVITDIEQLPPVLPEQKTGKWTYNIDDIFPMDSQMECGNCHASYPIYLCNEFKFCPNCGAKMER